MKVRLQKPVFNKKKKKEKKKKSSLRVALTLEVKFRVIFLAKTGRCLMPHLKTLNSQLMGIYILPR